MKMPELVINLSERAFKDLKEHADRDKISVEQLAEEELEKLYG